MTPDELARDFPAILRELHPTLNEDPAAQRPWWLCKKGHVYRARIVDRTVKRWGCPYCSGKIFRRENSLGVVNPELAGQWHPSRNKTVTPFDVSSCSNKKFWWLCPRGHEWAARGADRNRGRGCPFCAGKKFLREASFGALRPDLAGQWHPSRNGAETPFDVAPQSNRKRWWLCARGHEWQAQVCHRAAGSGCPYCAGKKACPDNSLAALRPGLAVEWHPTRNGAKTPSGFTPGSNKVVWWQCAAGHEWATTIASRASGCGCPFCANQKASPDNCLATVAPELAAEWHPTKNGGLRPEDLPFGSHRKGWWLCPKGHAYQALVSSRYHRSSGCRRCRNQVVDEDNCLATLRPDLAAEWHPTRNEPLMPRDVVPNSRRVVFWRCAAGHEWPTMVCTRAHQLRCPYCSGHYPPPEESFGGRCPGLAQWWDRERNGLITPFMVRPNSTRLAWWRCPRGHSFREPVAQRLYGHCPECDCQELGRAED